MLLLLLPKHDWEFYVYALAEQPYL